jgi:hypothetical protein
MRTIKFAAFFIILLAMAPLYFALALLIKKRELQALHFSAEKIKKGNFLLVAYIVLTMALLFVLMVFIPKNDFRERSSGFG